MGKEEGAEKAQGQEGAEGRSPLVETPEEEARRLRDELEARGREATENHGKYLRALADLDNYRKRTEKEKAEAISFANEALIEEVLPVIDNFERALSHAGADENMESLKKGVHLTVEQMFAVLRRSGLQEVKALGERFDPTLHHAISEEDSAEAEPGTVVKEFQKGYYLKGRLLRPAMVAVARKPEVH